MDEKGLTFFFGGMRRLVDNRSMVVVLLSVLVLVDGGFRYGKPEKRAVEEIGCVIVVEGSI